MSLGVIMTHTKVFIITGASSGIGLALTQKILALGHRVCACDINDVLLQQNFPKSYNDLLLKPLDISDDAQWQAVVSDVIGHWQRIDVLCNIAGILKENWVVDITADEVNQHFDINVKGTIFGTQSVLTIMQKQGDGHIINIASLAGLSAIPGLALYSASKFAVRAYSLAAAMELKKYGIAVTTICPDAVQTPMLDQQKGKAQAALTFSGEKPLTTEAIIDTIINEVLPNRPMEVMLPLKRGIIAKTANLFPVATSKIVGGLQKKGQKNPSFKGVK